MQFISIDDNNIYQGMVDAIEATPPDVGWYAPTGIRLSQLGPPPTDEPGKWRDTGVEWVEVTPEEQLAITKKQFTAAIDTYMDQFADERGYDSMASAASYQGDEDPQFDLEGTYCKKMRSRIYRQAWGIQDSVLAGERPMPTAEEVLAELPKLEWPEPEEPPVVEPEPLPGEPEVADEPSEGDTGSA